MRVCPSIGFSAPMAAYNLARARAVACPFADGISADRHGEVFATMASMGGFASAAICASFNTGAVASESNPDGANNSAHSCE